MPRARLVGPALELHVDEREQLLAAERQEVHDLVDAAEELVAPEVPLQDRPHHAVLEVARHLERLGGRGLVGDRHGRVFEGFH